MYSSFLFITQMNTLAVRAKAAWTQCQWSRLWNFFITSQNWCACSRCSIVMLPFWQGPVLSLIKAVCFFTAFTRVSMSAVSFPKVGLEDDKQSDGGNRSNRRSEHQQQQPQFSFTTRQSAEGDTAHSPVPWGGDGGGDGSSGGDRYAFLLSSHGLGVGVCLPLVFPGLGGGGMPSSCLPTAWGWGYAFLLSSLGLGVGVCLPVVFPGLGGGGMPSCCLPTAWGWGYAFLLSSHGLGVGVCLPLVFPRLGGGGMPSSCLPRAWGWGYAFLLSSLGLGVGVCLPLVFPGLGGGGMPSSCLPRAWGWGYAFLLSSQGLGVGLCLPLVFPGLGGGGMPSSCLPRAWGWGYAFLLSSQGLGVGCRQILWLFMLRVAKSPHLVVLSTSKLCSPARQSSTYVNSYFHPTAVSKKCVCMFMRFFGGACFLFDLYIYCFPSPLLCPDKLSWLTEH